MENFHPRSGVTTELREEGYAVLLGLTRWLELLNPLKHAEAWKALSHPGVANLLAEHPSQRPHFFLNDQGAIDIKSELNIEFRAKAEKSYLTLIGGSDSIASSPLLPASVQAYLEQCSAFMGEVHDYLTDCLPSPTLPTLLKLLIFDYHASDPLVEMRPPSACPHAMRPHVDGSICTLVIAPSDGLFRFKYAGQWHVARREDRKPFALLMPGIAAVHDLGITPTPHMVLPGLGRRVSVTLFLAPDLGHESFEQAEAQLDQWRLWTPTAGHFQE